MRKEKYNKLKDAFILLLGEYKNLNLTMLRTSEPHFKDKTTIEKLIEQNNKLDDY